MDIYILALAVIVIGAFLSVTTKKLTLSAALVGAALALVIFAGTSFSGFTMMVVFFAVGTAATAWKRELKQNGDRNAESKEGRNVGQVLANATVPALCALFAILDPGHRPLFILMLAAGFSSATSDTLSSELGMVYGRRFFNILSLRPDSKGEDGVVSLEGTAIGALGAMLIAFIQFCGSGAFGDFVVVALAGIAGNLCDSILGASLERRRIIGNDMVNFLNTLSAAFFAFLLVAWIL